MQRWTSIVVFLILGNQYARPAGRDVVLTGAGSTFIYPILRKWVNEYTKSHPEIKINYDPVGSGRGISRALAGTVDFGASDGPL